MKLRFVVFCLLTVIASSVSATAQWPDKIMYKGKEYSLHNNPMEPWFAKHPDKRPRSGNTALWRGYVATFTFKDNYLTLQDIESYKSVEGEKTSSWTSVMKEILPNDKALRVDWFTGILELPYGEVVNYVHMGYGTTYSNYVLLEIKKGKLTGSRTLTYDQYEKFKEALFQAYKNTDDYKNKSDEMRNDRTNQNEIDQSIRRFILSYATELPPEKDQKNIKAEHESPGDASSRNYSAMWEEDFSDSEWLALLRRPEHQPRTIWNGLRTGSVSKDQASLSISGMQFRNSPSHVLESHLSNGLLRERPLLFLSLLESSDVDIILTGANIYSTYLSAEKALMDEIKPQVAEAYRKYLLPHKDERLRFLAVQTLGQYRWLNLDDIETGLKDETLSVRYITALSMSVLMSERRDSFLFNAEGKRVKGNADDLERMLDDFEHLAPLLLDHLDEPHFYLRDQMASNFRRLFRKWQETPNGGKTTVDSKQLPPDIDWIRAGWTKRQESAKGWKEWWAREGRSVLRETFNLIQGSGMQSAAPEQKQPDAPESVKEEQIVQRKREKALQVQEETLEESVRNLMNKTYTLCPPLIDAHTTPSDIYFQEIRKEARINKLLKVATEGSESERQQLIDAIREMCRIYIEELPSFRSEGEPWKPTALHPGGGSAYPFLLRYVDDNAVALPLIVQMDRRRQAALREYFGDTSLEWGGSEDGMLMSYACDHFLGLYATRENLRQKITPEQLKIINEFQIYQKKRGTRKWKWFDEQFAIMRLAYKFVEAGQR